MKKALFMMAIVANFCASGQSNQIELNLLSTLFSNPNVSYFYNINDQFSIGASIGYKFSSPQDYRSAWLGYPTTYYHGFQIAPEIRYFPFGNRKKENAGFMLSGVLPFRERTGNNSPTSDKIWQLGVGGNVGYTFEFSKHLYLNAFSGMTYYFAEQSNSVIEDGAYQNQNAYEFSSLYVTMGLNIIWRFE